MRKFFKNKKKLLFVCLILMVSLTACSSPRGNDGKTKVNEIIASETFTVQKSYVNTTDVPDEVKEQYADYADDDMITIEATSFGDAMNTGWFNGFDRMADRAADQLDRRHDRCRCGYHRYDLLDPTACLLHYDQVSGFIAKDADDPARDPKDPE